MALWRAHVDIRCCNEELPSASTCVFMVGESNYQMMLYVALIYTIKLPFTT